MKTKNIDILSKEVLRKADAICFTANGIIKSNNELVMGAGVAKAFKDKWPKLPRFFGTLVKLHGNKVYYFEQQISRTKDIFIISFPTKHHWRNNSDIDLIKKSASELADLTNRLKWKTVYLPCPGIKNGNLNKDLVLNTIEPILDDRFTICFL